MTGPDRWIELTCPVCDGKTFDGQGYDSRGRYRHRCPDCDTLIAVPGAVDGERIGTR